MRNKTALILSMVSVSLPVLFVAMYLNTESEFAEAIAAGLAVGCATGSVTGTTALILNRRKNTLVTILAVLPIIPTAIFLLLWVPYYAFG